MQGTVTDGRYHTTESQVSAVNEALAEKVGPQKYRIWFRNSTKLTLTDGYLKVGVPNLFIASWIENHFLTQISDAVRAVIGSDCQITFAIDPELAGQQRRTQLDCQAQLVTSAQNRTTSQRARIQPPRGRNSSLLLTLSLSGHQTSWPTTPQRLWPASRNALLIRCLFTEDTGSERHTCCKGYAIRCAGTDPGLIGCISQRRISPISSCWP